MRILVTGAAGFVGSHFGRLMVGRGHSVVAVDDLSSPNAAPELLNLRDNEYSFVEGSVFDRRLLHRLAMDCDTIVHLAARAGVQRVLADPIGTMTAGLEGARNVSFAAKSAGCGVLFTSSSEVYGLNPKAPQDEGLPIVLDVQPAGRSSYPASGVSRH